MFCQSKCPLNMYTCLCPQINAALPFMGENFSTVTKKTAETHNWSMHREDRWLLSVISGTSLSPPPRLRDYLWWGSRALWNTIFQAWHSSCILELTAAVLIEQDLQKTEACQYPVMEAGKILEVHLAQSSVNSCWGTEKNFFFNGVTLHSCSCKQL